MHSHDKLFGITITPDLLMDELGELDGHEEFALTIINLLPEKHFDDCHIKGSISIDVTTLGDYVDDWDRTRAIVLYEAADETALCEQAHALLIDMGFSDVRILEGGMKEWLDKGYPVDGACVMKYLSD